MTEIRKNLIDIIRSVVIDAAETSDTALKFTTDANKSEDLKALFSLAKVHQVEHLVSYFLFKLGKAEYAKGFYSSLSNTTKQTYELSRIRAALTEAEIPFIVLKGPVVRKLYPDAWMRNSCDIDVLVKDEDVEKAGKVLEALSFKKEDVLSSHDVSYTNGSVHVELHYTLIEKYRFSEISDVLGQVWTTAIKDEGTEFVMPDEYYYFYHIAHMVKHFESGGCGIRSVLDLWILNYRTSFDKDKRASLLLNGGILKFEKELLRLANYWFSGGEGDSLQTLEDFIFTGGAYGALTNSVAVKKSVRGGRVAYLIHRLFVPYSQLVKYYPRLERFPILLPYYEVKRWVQAISRNGKGYRRELSENIKRDKDSEAISKMLESLGMK